MKYLFAILKLLPPELSHLLALNGLKLMHKFGLINFYKKDFNNKGSFTIANMSFNNKLGIAAGLDKNGDFIDSLGTLGFGFIEVGTTTPLAQLGNPKPRIFRAFDENAIINRLGFNNKGVDHLVKRLKSRNYKGVVGVNIGANKSSKGEKRIADYVECYKKVYDLSDYITINISSPNTPDLRDLHNETNINQLLSSIKKEKEAVRSQKPIFLKISPDETKDTIEIILKAVKKYEITGLVLTNTTIDKTNLRNEALKSEAGGLSGKPLFAKSTESIKIIKSLDNTIPVIGVGGVIDHSDYIAKFEAGADLVQIYTGFILKGPSIVSELLIQE